MNDSPEELSMTEFELFKQAHNLCKVDEWSESLKVYEKILEKTLRMPISGIIHGVNLYLLVFEIKIHLRG